MAPSVNPTTTPREGGGMLAAETRPDIAMSNSPKHFTYLDGWRGLAIIGVLVDHFLDPPYLNTGRFGVELFFVLSGRLMAEILFVREVPLGEFFLRRISRVWPALWVFVLVIAAAFLVSHHPCLLAYAVAALTFTSNYLSAAGYRFGDLDHMWSLCIEEHTYLFLGLLALFVRKGRASAMTICLVAGLVCVASGAFQTLVLHRDYYAVYWRTDTRASSILLAGGVYLALRRYKTFDACFSGGYTALLFVLVALALV